MKRQTLSRQLSMGILRLALLVSTEGAFAQLLGPEFQVNSYTMYTQYGPAVAASGSGDFVVTWMSYGEDGSGFGVFAQRFDSQGLPLGSAFQVNTATSRSETYPRIASTAAGDFVIVWESNAAYGMNRRLFGRRFDSTGAPREGEIPVSQLDWNWAHEASVASDPSGGFVVVWNHGSDIFGRRFDTGGSPAGDWYLIESHTTGMQKRPDVASAGEAGFVVVWQSYRVAGANYDIVARRLSSDGTPQGVEFVVNTYTTHAQSSPAVAADPSGGFVVAWQGADREEGSTVQRVFLRRFDANDVAAWDELQLSSATSHEQLLPDIASDEEGRFVVSWQSQYQDGSGWGTFARRFDATGTVIESEFRLNAYTTSDQRLPAVAADGRGDFVASWESHEQDGSWFGIFARQLRVGLFSDGFELGDSCAWSATQGGGSCLELLPKPDPRRS